MNTVSFPSLAQSPPENRSRRTDYNEYCHLLYIIYPSCKGMPSIMVRISTPFDHNGAAVIQTSKTWSHLKRKVSSLAVFFD